MPRGKKKTETPMITKEQARDTFVNCKLYTQDQIKVAISEMCARENVPQETANRINNVVESVISETFSKVMASQGY